jgi:hypothetical protein
LDGGDNPVDGVDVISVQALFGEGFVVTKLASAFGIGQHGNELVEHAGLTGHGIHCALAFHRMKDTGDGGQTVG